MKGPEILNPYVGVSEQTIRGLFERARKFKEKTGFPATIFIDEADAILAKRGTGISSDMDKTIVPMFLTEMDGLVDSSAFIILATNRADILDPAVVRDGRIDVKIKISRPQPKAAAEIVRINLRGTKVQAGLEDELIDYIVREIYDSSLEDNVSGAMVAEIVNQTITEAIRRDLEGNGKPSGINLKDASNAMEKLKKREAQMAHEETPQHAS